MNSLQGICNTSKYLFLLYFVAVLPVIFISKHVHGAFMVEAHSSGLANTNFQANCEPIPSIPSQAIGVTATNSVFGGMGDPPDIYIYSYRPGIDADNVWFTPGTDLGNGHVSTGLTGGTSGLYNVYITWPPTSSTDTSGSEIIITNDDEPVVLSAVNQNTGQTGNPGGNNAWYRIAEAIPLKSHVTYTVTQTANSSSYISQRSHGVLWELVQAKPQLITIVETDNSTIVKENGTADEFSIILNEQPPQPVIITLQSTELNQVIINDQMNNCRIVFTQDNWNVEQVVNIKAIADNIIEPDHSVMILCTTNLLDPDIDPDSNYNNGFGGIVTVHIIDNEIPGVQIIESEDHTTVIEGVDFEDSYTIRLLSPPTDNVTIYIETDHQTTIDVSPGHATAGLLVFTPDNWNVDQTVHVKAVDDSELEHSHISEITHTVSSLDDSYDGLIIPNVTVNIEDNECGTWGFHYFDYNRDCRVDIADLAEFAASWLSCTEPYSPGCDDLR